MIAQVTWEHTTKMMIQEMEERRTEVAHQVQLAQEELSALQERLLHWNAVLKDYQCTQGDSTNGVRNNINKPDYDRMGPTEIVLRWVSDHDGDFIVKEAGRAAYEAGAFTTQSYAYKMLGNIVRRRKDFIKVGRGHFRLKQLPESPRHQYEPMWHSVSP